MRNESLKKKKMKRISPKLSKKMRRLIKNLQIKLRRKRKSKIRLINHLFFLFLLLWLLQVTIKSQNLRLKRSDQKKTPIKITKKSLKTSKKITPVESMMTDTITSHQSTANITNLTTIKSTESN